MRLAMAGLAAAQGRHPSADAVLAAICFHLAWRPLLHKRISVTTLANLPWHLRVTIGLEEHNRALVAALAEFLAERAP